MPIQSTPDHELRIVHTICSGLITHEDIRHYQATTWLDPAIYGYNELYDFTDSDYSVVQFGDLISIAQRAAKLYMLDPNSRFAFLTHNIQHEAVADFYMAAKTFSSGSSREIRSFNSYEKVMAWLTEDREQAVKKISASEVTS